MKIYMDVCCLNRPFDNHIQDKIRLESEAILSILTHCQSKNWVLIGSEVIDIEISKIPDDNKKQKVKTLSDIKQKHIAVDKNVEKRALKLEEMSFKPFDALHLACAEKGKADVLLTTDDNFIQKALRNLGILKVKVENPVKMLMEVIEK